jgi:hypothetical protein
MLMFDSIDSVIDWHNHFELIRVGKKETVNTISAEKIFMIMKLPIMSVF